MSCLATSIVQHDPSLQVHLDKLEEATSLAALVLVAWAVARAVAVDLLEHVLYERAQAPTSWPACPVCDRRLESKGFRGRGMLTLLGPVAWRRRVGRCPNRCKIDQIAPFDQHLAILPKVRTDPLRANFRQLLS